MNMAKPTPIYRIIHFDNLAVCLQRGGFHVQNDGLVYRTIHNVDIQGVRRQQVIPCGPGGTVHDYLAFYFGPRSPMLYQLHTGWVEGYDEGQEPIIYIVSTIEEIMRKQLQFVFSDGHGIAFYTHWFDDINELNQVDWDVVYARVWKDTLRDLDRQRRKQAEFLVYQFCPFDVVTEIGVLNKIMKQKVKIILNQFGRSNIPVNIRRNWYY